MPTPDELDPENLPVSPAEKNEWTQPVLKKSEVAEQTALGGAAIVDGLGSTIG